MYSQCDGRNEDTKRKHIDTEIIERLTNSAGESSRLLQKAMFCICKRRLKIAQRKIAQRRLNKLPNMDMNADDNSLPSTGLFETKRDNSILFNKVDIKSDIFQDRTAFKDNHTQTEFVYTKILINSNLQSATKRTHFDLSSDALSKTIEV